MQRRLIQSPFCFLGNVAIIETTAGTNNDRQKQANFAVDRSKFAISPLSSFAGLSLWIGLNFRAHGKIVCFSRNRR